jgi:hypothetical protein
MIVTELNKKLAAENGHNVASTQHPRFKLLKLKPQPV